MSSKLTLEVRGGGSSNGVVLTAVNVHFHCWIIDGVFAVGEDGQIHIGYLTGKPGEGLRVTAAEAAAPTFADIAAVRQQVRSRAALVRPCRHPRSGRCARPSATMGEPGFF